ncbi:Putative RNA polymerase II transcription factor B subunit 1 [Cytospora mali]|uniref:RNA polymerase II transcription factor B subunit 1 n=1 Tax=Cytospora mali TaxID=578113 RepID=A0A194WBP5_CYTMA|nr:Putative RNA polymerase II transcription factor B subunit 1 [Valsa mali]
MAEIRAKAVYKKKDGIIAISDDQSTVTWTPLSTAGSQTVFLAIPNITNLKKTPDSAPKVMLKIFEKPPSSVGDPVPYTFQFNSPEDPRAEANAIKDVLSRLLTELRNNDPSVPKPAAPATTPAAATNVGTANAATNTVTNAKAAAAYLFDDNHLRLDIELQQALLRKDGELHKTYMDARATKPDSINDAAFNNHFWSTRTNLLRAFAIEVNQKRGAYNILPTFKTKTTQDAETGQEKVELNLHQAEILQIFNQHPIVKRAYNENVPKLSDGEFWSRFFLSRLCKQLKGERVSDTDRRDPVFDKYDASDDHVAYASKILAKHVPKTIDLEGNEENTGGVKSGNAKDVEMRPRKNVPIIQVLNATSEKLLSNVAPTDRDPEEASGMDDATWQELTLRDLEDDAEENRIRLNVKEQSEFFSEQNSAASTIDKAYEKQVPSHVLMEISSDIEMLKGDESGGVDLHGSIGVDEDSDSDEDAPKKAHVGSRAARKAAQKQILKGLTQSRAELYGHSSDENTPMGIPKDLKEKAKLTNATTNEFLKQFWHAFLSGDPDRAHELGYHVDSLRRSTLRIEAIADEAEQVRNKAIEEEKKRIRAYYQETGIKKRFKADAVGGGRGAVLTLMRPSLAALDKAQSLYKAALDQEGITMSTENDLVG